MQKLQITIPKPCHEEWQNMTPGEQGRFCNVCAKTVVDFSMMSDYEMLNYFSTVSGEKLCGRVLPNQLNREMVMPPEPKKRLFWYWNYITKFFMLFSRSNHAKAQERIVVKTEQKPSCEKMMLGMVTSYARSNGIISGKINNIDGRPIPGVSVRIRGTNTGTSADANGNFSIKVRTGETLEFDAVGFESHQQTISLITTNMKVTLTKVEMRLLGDVVITSSEIANTQRNQVFEIKVIDKETFRPVNKALIAIERNRNTGAETNFTNKSGIYKIRKVKGGEVCRVIVSAEGYENNEFTIEGSRIDSRKIIKEIYLAEKSVAKMPDELVVENNPVSKVGGLQINALNKTKTPVRVVMGGMRSLKNGNKSLVIVDGLQVPLSDINSIGPNDILNVQLSTGASASAIYGSNAQNGVLIVTTNRKKQIDSVRIAKALIKKAANIIGISPGSNTVDLYPNPVRSGRSFVVSFNLQQVGEIKMQIVDFNGRVVLERQLSTSSKDHLEKIETDDRWPAGMYFLNVFDSNGSQQGRSISAVSFVVQ